MTNATITTELDNRHYAPGDVLRGRVSWQVQTNVESAELRLFYYTVGKGTRDATVVETRALTAPGTAAQTQEDFSFTLPDGPYSFSGEIVSLIWGLELVLEPGHHLERLEFTLSPTGHEIELHRYPVPPELAEKSKAKEWFRVQRNR